MGIEFSTILAAPDSPIIDIAVRLEQAFKSIGLRHDFGIVRAAYDRDLEVFDELQPEQESRVKAGFAELSSEVADWPGFSVEYWSDGLPLYVLVGRQTDAASYLNLWIDIGERHLAKLIKANEVRRFVSVIASAASAANALGGYGHSALDFHRLAPDGSVAAISSLPEFPGQPASLGVIPVTTMSQSDIQKVYGRQFDCHFSALGFWILLHRDFATSLGS
jgi:hypothetical protein